MNCVRFLKAYSIYNPGEVAGFSGDVVERLVAAEVAEMYVAKPAPAMVTKAVEPAKRKRGRPPKVENLDKLHEA